MNEPSVQRTNWHYNCSVTCVTDGVIIGIINWHYNCSEQCVTSLA